LFMMTEVCTDRKGMHASRGPTTSPLFDDTALPRSARETRLEASEYSPGPR
jgi:hypothetical protein